MQHHVALTRNHPAFMLPFCRGKHRFIHIKRLAINPVGIMEIKRSAMLHVAHVAHVAMLHIPHLTVVHIVIIHMAHHLSMIHTRHGLTAEFLHQHLHAHHIEHRINRQLQLAHRQTFQ